MRDVVLAAHATPDRKYHTLQHLQQCLSVVETVSHLPDRPAEVEMARWFHDAIYEFKGANNEARSADWAHEELRRADVDPAVAARVRDLAPMTCHASNLHRTDEQLLVDIDLAILGAEPARFAECEQQIREELARVPSYGLRTKRKSVFKPFLDRETIYSTQVLHQKLEARARNNLASALAGQIKEDAADAGLKHGEPCRHPSTP
ncbi:MAG: N-methyl-D-aspartate receptor NMDAR2C subunit [Paucibacter sp.]|nr:N-methyl-D-aspartate receptor NMDAR2C subunit [Roseateles sp.]